MDKINQQELQALVSRPSETSAIQKNSLEESSALMLAGMLQLAAANAKYELTESEIEFWKRQVAEYPAEMIQKFFSEHIATSKWMPQFADLHEWAERENEARWQKRQEHEYRDRQRRQYERVMAWRSSPDYERDMQEIHQRLVAMVANCKRQSLLVPKRDIPLAFSPDKEKQIISNFTKERCK